MNFDESASHLRRLNRYKSRIVTTNVMRDTWLLSAIRRQTQCPLAPLATGKVKVTVVP